MIPLRAHSVYRNLDSFGPLNLLSHCHTLRLCYKTLCVVESAKKELINLPPTRLQHAFITTLDATLPIEW